MTITISEITSIPATPVKNTPTAFSRTISGEGHVSQTNWIIKPAINANNQLNGGIWGGGAGALMMTCNFSIENP